MSGKGGMVPSPFRVALALLLFIAIADGSEQGPPLELSSTQALMDIEGLYKALVGSPSPRFAPEEQMVQLPVASGAQAVPQQAYIQVAQPQAQPQQQQQAVQSPAQSPPPVQGATAQPPAQQQVQQAPQQVQQQQVQQQAQQQPLSSQAQPTPLPTVLQGSTTTAAAPQPQQPIPQPIPQSAAEKAALQKQAEATAQKQAGEKKVHQAQNFNVLVKQVNTILDGAITSLKTDRQLFQKAVVDGQDKRSGITEKAQQAKLEAKGNSVLVSAIDTHVAIAGKENAKAFITFAKSFRQTAKKTFWKSYNKAKRKKTMLLGLFDKITHHVGRAVKAMRKKISPKDTKYLTALKAYYKARYSCGSLSKGKAKEACMGTKKKAKAMMKAYHSSFLEFKSNYKTAHHHGKKLRRRLKQAIHKLRFVFKQARQEVRKSQVLFHAGFDEHYAARKSISLTALKEVQQQRLEVHKQIKLRSKQIKLRKQAKSEEKSEEAPRKQSPAAKEKEDADVNRAATAMVKQAAKAIIKAKHSTHGQGKKAAEAMDKAVIEKKAEKKAVLLLKNVVKQAKKDEVSFLEEDTTSEDSPEESFLENMDASWSQSETVTETPLEENEQVPDLSAIVLEEGPHRHDVW